MRRLFFAALALAGAGCKDFNAAYQDYCQKSGQCADGGGPTGDGGVSGNDGGSDGGGGGDAGPGICARFGAPCTGAGQCCTDAGVFCSRLNFCQPSRSDCRADGYECAKSAECCTGLCTGGRCAIACGINASGTCSRESQCCYDFSDSCGANGMCLQGLMGSFPDGTHCPSADWCSSGYCHPVDAGGPLPDGICQSDGGCGILGGSSNCCPGLQLQAGVCCLPDGAAGYYASHCCSGNALGGICVPNAFSAARGTRCTNDPDCPAPLWCDFLSGSCQDHLCFPPQQNGARGGCCIMAGANSCAFLDGGSCLMDGVVCSQNSDCCSGNCNTGHCNGVSYFQ